ncbi:MAG: hypothetical protein GY786_11545 [Proteobacteria bacterium]|nr:hypothetical protein [Pseudomonadota bacterium]
MIEMTVKRISRQLEILTKCNIEIERALDLLEATTIDLEEIIAINTLRESFCELSDQKIEDYAQIDTTIIKEASKSFQYCA